MKNKKTYVNPKEVKEIVLYYERESTLYEWYDETQPQRKTILWGLIQTGWTEGKPAGWGYSRRYTDDEVLTSWESIKIDRSGLAPKTINKAGVTVYFGYKHSSHWHFETNEEAEDFANEISEQSDCKFVIK